MTNDFGYDKILLHETEVRDVKVRLGDILDEIAKAVKVYNKPYQLAGRMIAVTLINKYRK